MLDNNNDAVSALFVAHFVFVCVYTKLTAEHNERINSYFFSKNSLMFDYQAIFWLYFYF